MPIVTIQSPSGEEIQIEAPEGATDEQIFSFAKSQGLFSQQEATGDNSDFIPTDENLAAPLPTQPETSLLDDAIGLGEAALTTVTGATGGALGFWLGAVEGIVGELTGRIPQGEGIKEAERLASELTFAPRTESGQSMVKNLGETLSVLPPLL